MKVLLQRGVLKRQVAVWASENLRKLGLMLEQGDFIRRPVKFHVGEDAGRIDVDDVKGLAHRLGLE